LIITNEIENATSNQPKAKNSTHNYTKNATNKSLVENFVQLNHRTLSKLNIKDVNGHHYTNITWKMIEININIIGVVPKRAKEFQFCYLFSICIASFFTSILSHVVGFSRSYSNYAIF